jgi:hypothetical protein
VPYWLESNVSGVNIAELSGCIDLQHLAVCAVPLQLAPADWASLAALTRLTELRLLSVEVREATPEACAALRQLTRLQVAATQGWSQALIPALTACASLTEISGSWYPLSSSECPTLSLP